ncbi:hypothetical protein D0Y65_035838 [Glycine soja]|uniref:Uncharacterized protein n=1 Tax=Glycine soja TaxID=3848 RepID=A0A445HBU4_GLYSO|nr:hypothetical protein D0Y65_035838 [Glycine soja]
MARKLNSIMEITAQKEAWKADKIDAQIKNVDPGKWNDVVKMVHPLSWIPKLINLSLWANVIRELVDVLQWSLDGKPKKVVFTMKDKWNVFL